MLHQGDTSSESLMARYQSRLDGAAFEEIVARFLAPALAVARQILTDRALAEDAVQEAFLRLVRRREQYVAPKPFSSWFYAILRNVCRDMLRRRARHKEMLERAAVREAAAAPAVELLDTLDLLGGLPRKARAVLTLRIVHDMAFRDVAAALGISEAAAKKRAQRALRQLRKRRAVQELLRDELSPQPARRRAEEQAPAGLAEDDVPGPAS